ncbi:SGNH/GDSL hydrolase family protein [Alcanivorax sp. DP30]|uniref:SGNH/GDSL hydrolase family protein n=1 Tax=Alcanivorax sp. DP30 TaxID=2606217 RepID=UPI00136E2DCD|nr:SGNH/GDSL hydrolase family protein [Alcanivorax sp. DP30]MZR62486.1 SGNH/GDSL hydrolase family protein [Alcanivorax sp. DP30]
MHVPFWLTVAALSPAIVPLAAYTRRTTLRLPEASGDSSGEWGSGLQGFRLLVIGESTAAGVGVTDHQQGLASQLAKQLARRTGKATWQTLGTNGIRMAGLIEKLGTSTLPDCDAVFVSMGVNDTTGLTPRRQYYRQLEQLIALLRNQRPEATIYLLAVPPMHRFSALPAPLRQILGWRARLLDDQQHRLAATTPGVCHLGYPPLDDPSLLAEDGYHPSATGYQAMAVALNAQLFS